MSEIKRRNRRFELQPCRTDFRTEKMAQKEKIWERQFFYLLTPALMGDPFPTGVGCRVSLGHVILTLLWKAGQAEYPALAPNTHHPSDAEQVSSDHCSPRA